MGTLTTTLPSLPLTARMYKFVLMLVVTTTVLMTLWVISSSFGERTPFIVSDAAQQVPEGAGRDEIVQIPKNFEYNQPNNGRWGAEDAYKEDNGVSELSQLEYEWTAPGERVNGAIVVLVRNSELQGLRKSMRMFEDRFNRRFNYPYVILNDVEFTQEFKDGIASITRNEVRYGVLNETQWGYSPGVTAEKTAERLEYNKDRYLYGGSLSYRFMCRFQSGFFYKHPLIADLDWYWRLEPDVEYYCDIDYDPFVFMRDNGIKYGFTIAPRESRKTVETLWNHTRTWIRSNPDLLPETSLVNWVMGTDGKFNMCHFWSNFEIVDLSLYRSEAYESYFQHLDHTGGFFYERWGDAPVHSIAATLFLSKGQIHWFEDIGYKHPGNMHCPKDESMLQKCICNPARSYTYRSACQKRFEKVNNMKKERLLEIIRNTESEFGGDNISVADS